MSHLLQTIPTAQNSKIGWQNFSKELKVLKDQNKPILDCVIVQDLWQRVRIKTNRIWKSTDVITKITEVLSVIRQLNFQGVKDLSIEVEKFTGQISFSQMKEFLDYLSSLKNLEKLQVIELLPTKVNAYSFLLFFFYEPKDPKQEFSYSNTSIGRKSIIDTKHQNLQIVQKIEFQDGILEESEDSSQLIQELKVLNKELARIFIEEWKSGIDQEKENQLRIVKLLIYTKQSNLKEFLDCSFDILSMMNQYEKIQEIAFMSVGALLPDTNKVDFDMKRFQDLHVLQKIKLNITVKQGCDVDTLLGLLRHLKGIDLSIQSGISGEKLKIETLTDLIQKEISESSQDYHNLEEIHIKEPHNIFSELPHFQFVDLFKNIKKVSIEIASLSVYEVFKENQKYIIKYINQCSRLEVCDGLQFQNDILSLSAIKSRSFFKNNVSLIEEVLDEINKPIHLYVYTELIQHKYEQFINLISKLAFNNKILSLRFRGKANEQQKDYIELVKRIKLYHLYLITYEKLISPEMIFNPRNIILDLFFLE